jgi:hypothetical protein
MYSWCWTSPAESFSGLNPAELIDMFYRLDFETPRNCWAKFPHLFPQKHWDNINIQSVPHMKHHAPLCEEHINDLRGGNARIL